MLVIRGMAPVIVLGWWGWPLLLAPFIGSFLGAIVTRADAPGSLVLGRSACPHCQTPLTVRDLLPVLSWLALRGRCRHCGQPIGLFYPAVELGALGVAGWAALVASGAALWTSCVFGWALLALALTDLKYFLLPDFLTLPLIAAGLAAGWLLEPDDLPAHIIGAIVGLGFVLAVRYVYRMLRGREGMGLGDAKLLAASGAWVGWSGLPSVVLMGALAGLAYAVLRQRGRGGLSATDRVPFGAFLCLGTWIVWLHGPLTIAGAP